MAFGCNPDGTLLSSRMLALVVALSFATVILHLSCGVVPSHRGVSVPCILDLLVALFSEPATESAT